MLVRSHEMNLCLELKKYLCETFWYHFRTPSGLGRSYFRVDESIIDHNYDHQVVVQDDVPRTSFDMFLGFAVQRTLFDNVHISFDQFILLRIDQIRSNFFQRKRKRYMCVKATKILKLDYLSNYCFIIIVLSRVLLTMMRIWLR